MRFSETHEWIHLEGSLGTVGITDFAQKELGEIVYVELPKIGQKVKAGSEICVLESTKAAADVYAPVTGKITAVNEGLRKIPSAINQYAETGGWLFKIQLDDPKELNRLMSRSDYLSKISQ